MTTVPLRPPTCTVGTFFFPFLISGRKPSERGVFRSFVRTMRTASEAHFGPFPASLRPLSLTQPNHGRFGTDVERSIIQWVRGGPKGIGFEKASLKRSEQGSNRLVRCVCFRQHTDQSWGGFDRLVVAQGGITIAHPASGRARLSATAVAASPQRHSRRRPGAELPAFARVQALQRSLSHLLTRPRDRC